MWHETTLPYSSHHLPERDPWNWSLWQHVAPFIAAEIWPNDKSSTADDILQPWPAGASGNCFGWLENAQVILLPVNGEDPIFTFPIWPFFSNDCYLNRIYRKILIISIWYSLKFDFLDESLFFPVLTFNFSVYMVEDMMHQSSTNNDNYSVGALVCLLRGLSSIVLCYSKAFFLSSSLRMSKVNGNFSRGREGPRHSVSWYYSKQKSFPYTGIT